MLQRQREPVCLAAGFQRNIRQQTDAPCRQQPMWRKGRSGWTTPHCTSSLQQLCCYTVASSRAGYALLACSCASSFYFYRVSWEQGQSVLILAPVQSLEVTSPDYPAGTDEMKRNAAIKALIFTMWTSGRDINKNDLGTNNFVFGNTTRP